MNCKLKLIYGFYHLYNYDSVHYAATCSCPPTHHGRTTSIRSLAIIIRNNMPRSRQYSRLTRIFRHHSTPASPHHPSDSPPARPHEMTAIAPILFSPTTPRLTDTCPICTNKLNSNPSNPPFRIVSKNCNHAFCENCLMDLLKGGHSWSNKCPVCRTTWVDPSRPSRYLNEIESFLRELNVRLDDIPCSDAVEGLWRKGESMQDVLTVIRRRNTVVLGRASRTQERMKTLIVFIEIILDS
ncbi:unnamed protein product [Periconia digitata]|uniref:RING-type domain-containing protein n=1 Tax=Periconia digitata TaxID=1303443 RepID=A0A9W4UI68_9PLEO|nr:unnamed protein product [Periconia digitata]